MQVDILLASYNGEKYIAQQIESIQSQTFQDWRLLIHDDGSDDDTVVICKKYVENDSRILYLSDGITGLGVARHFIYMLKYVTSDFVMFCDQDDIWLPEKIDTMLSNIKQKDQSKAQVVFSNAYLWNPEHGIISKRNTLSYPRNLDALLFLNSGVQGAASIFNGKMVTLMQRPLDYYAMHDHVLILAALCFGNVDYIDEPLFYYRQHDENVSGNAPGSFTKKAKLASGENRKVPVIDSHHLKGVEAFYDAYKGDMSAKECESIGLFLALPKMKSMQRMYHILHHPYKLYNSKVLLMLKVCLRPFVLKTMG